MENEDGYGEFIWGNCCKRSGKRMECHLVRSQSDVCSRGVNGGPRAWGVRRRESVQNHYRTDQRLTVKVLLGFV